MNAIRRSISVGLFLIIGTAARGGVGSTAAAASMNGAGGQMPAFYDGTLFTGLAVAGGVWQYRTHVRQGRQQGLAVFVAAQLLWLGVVLWQNGVLLG